MKRRFVFKDAKSDKFWEIEYGESPDVEVRYGRTGTDGQRKAKSHGSVEAAVADAEKQIKAKTKKGYTEVESSDGAAKPPPAATAEDPKEHFRYLVDHPSYQPVFDAVFSRAVNMTTDSNGGVTVTFADDQVLIASAPAEEGSFAGWPPSFRRLMARHKWLSFPDDGGWCLNMGDGDLPDDDMLAESEIADHAEGVRVPFIDYSDWWLYHPTDKTRAGEPGLCYLCHEGGDIDAITELPAGSVFLKRMAEIMELEIELPEPDASESQADASNLEWLDPVELDVPEGDVDTLNQDRAHLVMYSGNSLTWWELDSNLIPRRVAAIEIPAHEHAWSSTWGEHTIQWVGDNHVFYSDGCGYAYINCQNSSEPVVEHAFRYDWCRTAAVAVKHHVHFGYYLHDKDGLKKEETKELRSKLPVGDGLAVQALDGNPESVRIWLGKEYDYPQQGRVDGDLIYWVTQNQLIVVDVSDPANPAVRSHMPFDACAPKIIIMSDLGLLAHTESDFADKHGLTLVDITKKKPKRKFKLYKKFRSRGWSRDRNTMVLLLENAKEKRFLTRVDLSAAEIVEGPIVEIELDAEPWALEHIVARGNTIGILHKRAHTWHRVRWG